MSRTDYMPLLDRFWDDDLLLSDFASGAELGGPGSGYGDPHYGRPGQVGGSLPRDDAGVITVSNVSKKSKGSLDISADVKALRDKMDNALWLDNVTVADGWGDRQKELQPDPDDRDSGDALYWYKRSEDNSGNLNKLLRLGEDRFIKEVTPEWWTPEQKAKDIMRWKPQMAGIDRAMKRCAVPEDVVVFRGGKGMAEWFRSALPGDEFVDKGFVSTTLSSELAKDAWFAGKITGPRIPMEIYVPKGTHAVYLNGPWIDTEHEEAELLLDRGLRFRFLGLRGVDDDAVAVLAVVGKE